MHQLRDTGKQFDQTVGADGDWIAADRRSALAPKVLPILHKIIQLDDQLMLLQPEAREQIRNWRLHPFWMMRMRLRGWRRWLRAVPSRTRSTGGAGNCW